MNVQLSKLHKLLMSSRMANQVTPMKVIKRANSIISPILSLHFNYLMIIGKFPDMLKTGKITPIYKKEDEEQLENYRPISTLPIFGKIFEKLIYKRLDNFFVAQNLLHDKQFGFRKKTLNITCY